MFMGDNYRIGPDTRAFRHIGDITLDDLTSLEGQVEGLDIVPAEDIVYEHGYDTERFGKCDPEEIYDEKPSELLF